MIALLDEAVARRPVGVLAPELPAQRSRISVVAQSKHATCVRPACSPDCVDPKAQQQRGAIAQALVAARTAAALLLAVALVRLIGIGNGAGAQRRSGWTLHVTAKLVLAAIGVEIRSRGSIRSGAALVVGNHTSFLDILVLAAATPMRQVAKQEIGDWPLVGAIARRTGSIFLDRARWRALPGVVSDAELALRRGAKVQVFPEATTRCGTALDPFYRSMFAAAIDAAVVVAPVTLRYSDGCGERTAAPAFLGDEELTDALRRVLALRELTVDVHWLPAIPAIAGTGHRATDRARLAGIVERAVAADLDIPVLVRSLPSPGTAILVG